MALFLPATLYTPNSSTMAMTMCIIEPAVMTSSRFGYDLLRYVTGSSAGSVSSRLFMPTMRTNAPIGRARTPYSTPLR
ncbi:unannotated protein [freshwater metagenome]|uniref:Unannotated protein n=1 Tax=freshwater metagenome TaxID=449393 RepID=A0A6J6PT42_9ZZZZ